MIKPYLVDAFFESFFAVGGAFLRAAESGVTDKSTYEKHKDFWTSTNQGLLLTLWCHYVETYYGGRDNFIACISDAHNKQVVRILFYSRNAFVHAGWDISRLDPRFGQEDKIREFVGSGYTHPSIKVFKMEIDSGNLLHVNDLLGICHVLNKEAESKAGTKSP